MKFRWLSIVFCVVALSGVARADRHQEDEASTSPAERAEGEVEAASSDLPVYVPPSRGAKASRVGAATRGVGGSLQPVPLAPTHVGLTTRAQPVLYWSLAEDSAGRLDVVVAGEASSTALFEWSKGAPRAGLQRVALADQGVSLELGKVYQCVGTLVQDPKRPWKDRVAYAAIERVAATPELERDLAAAPHQAYAVYARHGLWYDALQDVSERIEAKPEDASLRRARASLLEQVKRGAAARWDLAPNAKP